MSHSSTSKELRQVSTGTLHVGVDLGLEKNWVVVKNERGERLDRFNFETERGGYAYFLERVTRLRQKQGATGLVVAMEPTNYFWKLLAQELEEQGVPYRLVNAYTVKKHREGDRLDRSKDDPRDANQIAELSRTGHFTQTRLQKGVYEELRQYATFYTQTVKAIRRQEHILWGLVGQAFPELRQVFQDLEGDTSRAVLVSCACAAQIRQLSEAEFETRVRAAYQGKRFCRKKVQQAYRLAAHSIATPEGLPALQLALQLHFATWQTLQSHLTQVRHAMTQTVTTLPEVPYLLSMNSFTMVSVALFLAEVGDPYHYRSAAQWVKLAGIQPAPNMSGKKQRSQTPMSHQGRAHLRTLLYFACLRLIQHDPHFAQLYSHLQRRSTNPLTPMQAIGVLMNKLLHLLWALIHTQTYYNPSFAQSI